MASKKQTYTFDIILTKSNLPPPKEDDTTSEYTFSVRIFKDFVDLPFERMWVENFPKEPLGEIIASPCDLIGSLTSKGVCITLTHKQDVLGSGTATLTPLVLRQLTDPTFEVIQTIDMEILKQGKNVDTIQMKLKFSSQHPELHPELYSPFDVCRTVDPSLHPRDLVFTLGRSCKCPGTVCITDERLMSHANAPFQCVHAPNTPKGVWNCCLTGGEVPPPPPPDQDKRLERNTLNDLLKELEIGKERVPEPPASHAAGRRWRCQCKRMQSDSDSDTDDCSENAFHLSGGHVDGEEDERRKALGPCTIDEPKLTQTRYQKPTMCPLCQSDISWLPRTAACPYCGYRNYNAALTENPEEDYDDSATAQKLLDDFVRKDKCQVGTDDDEEHSSGDSNKNIPKTCGCVSGRPCTRCRIRKLCENIFKQKDLQRADVTGEHDIPKTPPKTPPKKDPNELDKKDSTASQRRSQLIKIFNEMRNVYDKKKKSSQEDLLDDELRKELEAQCAKTKTSRARQRARRNLDRTLREIDEAYPSPPKRKKVCKRKHRLQSKRYSFLSIQKADPFSRIGHNTCISEGSDSGYCKIPCHMGWMWTKSEMSRFKSWKPGAISKPIKELMSYFLKDFPVDSICLSRYHKCSRKSNTCKEQYEEEPLVQHPTLHISKKHDEYVITLRPLKDAKALAVCANPYANMNPVVFRITKDPFAVKVREIKTGLKDRGFAPCTCKNPVKSCYCRSFVDRQRLEYALEVLCQELQLPAMSDSFIYSEDEDGDSEEEYEFGVTPPAGVVKPERLWPPDYAHAETQYVDNDWAMVSMFPHPPNPLIQYGGCVMGERKDKFNWIYGKGQVHNSPAKPPQRVKPKTNKNKGKKRLQGGYVSEQTFEAFVTNPNPLRIPTHNPGRRIWHKSSSPEATSTTDVSYSHIRY